MGDTMTDDAPRTAVRTPMARRRIELLAVAIVLVVAASIGGLVFEHWRTDLHLFPGEGNLLGAPNLPVGHSFYAGQQVVAPDRPIRLDIDSITPVVTVNSADATVKVLLCSKTADASIALGAAGDLGGICASARPFSRGRYLLAQTVPTTGTVTVILQITPKRSGHVHVSGLRVRYHRGLRHGDQVTGIEADTRTP